MAKSDRPPRTPPQTTQGLRLPKRERVRSERLPKTRLETSETRAVTALIEPRRAVGLSTPMSLRRWGRSTEATVLRPMAHSREMPKKPTPKRISVERLSGTPVSGARLEGEGGAAVSTAVDSCVWGMCDPFIERRCPYVVTT